MFISATPMCSSLLLLFSLPAHSNSDMNCYLVMLRFSPHFAHILSWFCPYFAQVLPRFCLGFVQVAWQTQLTILSNEKACSYCVHLVIKRCMKPGRERFKSMTMAFCCNQMQLWRESDQNCVRMQFWTKMKSRPYQEKPNPCWVFTGFSPKGPHPCNICFDERYLWKHIQRRKQNQLTEYQVRLSNSNRFAL